MHWICFLFISIYHLWAFSMAEIFFAFYLHMQRMKIIIIQGLALIHVKHSVCEKFYLSVGSLCVCQHRYNAWHKGWKVTGPMRMEQRNLFTFATSVGVSYKFNVTMAKTFFYIRYMVECKSSDKTDRQPFKLNWKISSSSNIITFHRAVV